MCLLVILRRPEHPWPLLFAANRDEKIGRPWRAPGRHWPDRPEVVGGLDLLAGGSWLALNDWGVAAAVLNRSGSLGPAPGRRSRGELVLEALDHADAVAAAAALSDLDPKAYRTFNLIVADNRDAFWLAMRGEGIEVKPVKEGLSLIGSGDLDDGTTPRLLSASPRFASAPAPDPDRGDWSSWERLLGDPKVPQGQNPGRPIRLPTVEGYGTTSSALIALPALGAAKRRPVFRFASWRPEPVPWQDISVFARQ
jgi:uncharacterized protein with NRDE domain